MGCVKKGMLLLETNNEINRNIEYFLLFFHFLTLFPCVVYNTVCAIKLIRKTANH
jgi:hypothetical protein